MWQATKPIMDLNTFLEINKEIHRAFGIRTLLAEDLAVAIDRSPSFVSKLRKGKTSCSLETALKICEACGHWVRPKELIRKRLNPLQDKYNYE